MSDSLTEIDIALAEIRVLQCAFARLEAGLERLRQEAVQGRISTLPPCDVPATEHRRQHRMGRAPIIDTDPELQAFILARIDRMTYQQIADAVAQHFPPGRRIGKSAIHDWWKRERRQPARR